MPESTQVAPASVPDIASLIPEPPPLSILYWDDDGVYIFCPESGHVVFFASVRHADRQFHIRTWVKGQDASYARMQANDPDFKAAYLNILTSHPRLRGVGYISNRGRWEGGMFYD